MELSFSFCLLSSRDVQQSVESKQIIKLHCFCEILPVSVSVCWLNSLNHKLNIVWIRI